MSLPRRRRHSMSAQVQPTADETDWNAVVFYTRRNHPIKPYLRFLKRDGGACAADGVCASPEG